MKCARYTTTYIYTYIFVLFYCRDAIQKHNVPAHIFYVTTFCILLHYASNNVLLYTIYFKCTDVLLCTSRLEWGHSTFDYTRINDLLYTIHFIVTRSGLSRLYRVPLHVIFTVCKKNVLFDVFFFTGTNAIFFTRAINSFS